MKMNIKELQAVVEGVAKEQGVAKGALEILEKALAERLEELRTSHDALREKLDVLADENGKLTAKAANLDGTIELMASDRVAMVERIETLETLVNGRNKSAATKRNMTEADAYRVLTGDCKDLNHKDAAELIGLTYAQVYSCRGEFTFKDVHKALREQGWKNPFRK
jgi:chromosome segregation ATPase